MAHKNFSTDGMTEVYPEDLGAFYLTDSVGRKLENRDMQKIFNDVIWKSFFIDGAGRFACVDHRNGKGIELKITQLVK